MASRREPSKMRTLWPALSLGGWVLVHEQGSATRYYTPHGAATPREAEHLRDFFDGKNELLRFITQSGILARLQAAVQPDVGAVKGCSPPSDVKDDATARAANNPTELGMPELGLFSLLRLGGWVSGKGKGLDESNRWYTPWGATHKARATRHIDFFVGNQELTIYIAQSGIVNRIRAAVQPNAPDPEVNKQELGAFAGDSTATLSLAVHSSEAAVNTAAMVASAVAFEPEMAETESEGRDDDTVYPGSPRETEDTRRELQREAADIQTSLRTRKHVLASLRREQEQLTKRIKIEEFEVRILQSDLDRNREHQAAQDDYFGYGMKSG